MNGRIYKGKEEWMMSGWIDGQINRGMTDRDVGSFILWEKVYLYTSVLMVCDHQSIVKGPGRKRKGGQKHLFQSTVTSGVRASRLGRLQAPCEWKLYKL